MPSSLGKKVIKGGVWVFALRGTQRLFSFVRLIILARILAPADFGLFGIAMLTIGILETFSQFGISAALVQKKDDIKSTLDTAWTIQVIRALILSFILILIAPYAASFFNTKAAIPILYVLAISTFLGGFINIRVVYFRKELEFHKQFIYVFIPTLFDIGVSITAAIILRNAWALVFGWIVRIFVVVILSYIMAPYKPHFRLNKEESVSLLNFGKWIFGSSILVFFITHGDDIFVGKLLGTAMLGFYQMAYRISNLPATEITHVISQVTFPAYSKLQDKSSQLRSGYLKTLQITAFISIPIAGAISFLAPDFVRIFLGKKWVPIIPTLQILAIWGMVYSILETAFPLFNGIGLPKITTHFNFAKLALLTVFIYPLTIKWGIIGTSLAVLMSSLLVIPFVFYKVTKVIQCGIWSLVKLVFLPLIGTSVMVGGLSLLKYLIINFVNLTFFIVLIFAGVLIYWGMMHLFDCFGNYGIKLLIKKQLSLLIGG